MTISQDIILDWCEKVTYVHRENVFVRRLRDAGFATHEIRKIVEALDTICKDCFDGPSSCQCENEE